MARSPAGTDASVDPIATVVDDLKQRARELHRAATEGDPNAIARLARLEADEPVAAVQRRHCLAAIARELGFDGWSHLTALLRTSNDDGGGDPPGFGTVLYPSPGASAAYWNIWCASYEEARAIRAEHGGYLLAYERQFFVAESHFLNVLGVDADDPDWDRIGRDWVAPKEPAARARLCAKIIAHRLAADAQS